MANLCWLCCTLAFRIIILLNVVDLCIYKSKYDAGTMHECDAQESWILKTLKIVVFVTALCTLHFKVKNDFHNTIFFQTIICEQCNLRMMQHYKNKATAVTGGDIGVIFSSSNSLYMVFNVSQVHQSSTHPTIWCTYTWKIQVATPISPNY